MKALEQLAEQTAQLETDLGKVRRWSNFQGRYQTTLAHTATVSLVGMVVIAVVRQHDETLVFNDALLLGALLLHDLGETVKAGEGKDTVYLLKSDAQDALELAAFKRQLESHPENIREGLLTHHLLQYVRKREAFAGKDRETLDRLAELHLVEAQLFELVERFDYLLYAYNELKSRGNMRIMIHTLRNQHARICELARIFKGFEKEYYTPGFRHWAEGLLRRHEHDKEEAIQDAGVAA